MTSTEAASTGPHQGGAGPGGTSRTTRTGVRVVRLKQGGRTTLTWSRRLVWVGVWALVSFTVASALFLTSSRETTLASHEAVLRPSFHPTVQIRSGPLLPDLRMDSGAPIGVSIDLGKTDTGSTDELLQRYALLASQPDPQVEKVKRLLVDMAVQASLRGAALGFVPVAAWALVGRRRRRELLRALTTRRGLAGALGLAVLGVAVWQPWVTPEPKAGTDGDWVPIGNYLGSAVPVPDALGGIEIWTDATTSASKRLVESVVDTYDKSKTFYDKAAADAATLALRQPSEDETVALLVSDRHDNVGIDQVARAIGDRGGATAVLDAGDDTSTGSSWEAFSLDSLNSAFSDLDRYVAVGNHDNGRFVEDYLRDKGWTAMDGTVRKGPGGVTMMGVADPRSSGLGSWRDEKGKTFAETRTEVADRACAAEGGRVGLLLVHDTKLGAEALERGCVGLVIGGHLHVQNGPDRVVATAPDPTPSSEATSSASASSESAGSESAGSEASGDTVSDRPQGLPGDAASGQQPVPSGINAYTFTNGTTGGAAFGIAVGSKPKRDAQVSLITFRDGEAVGIQPVTLRTDGKYLVQDWVALDDTLPTTDI